MAIIQALKNLVGGDGRKTVYDKTPAPTSGFENLSEKEKLAALVAEVRTYDSDNRQRRNMGNYLVALWYQGYQGAELNSTGDGIDVYEKSDYYTENQFRKGVDAVVGMLNELEVEPVARPGSDDPKDIAAARVADPALEMIDENIGYDQVRDQKNLYKALFGTSFQLTDYVVDKKYGTVVNPKFRYEEMPGEDGEPILSKIADGFEKRSKGSEIAVACSPLEINCRTDIKGGMDNLPWLQWLSWVDVNTVNYAYPGLNESPTGGSQEEVLARHYMSVLGSLTGNIVGQGLVITDAQGKVELGRTWLQPCEFRANKALLKAFPEGVHVTTVNGRVVDYYPENLVDRWTIEKLILLPHSFLGDGLYDALMQQDQLNEVNSLIIKHLRFSSVGHKLYNANELDPKDVVNDPENGWVPVRPGIGVNVSQSVFDLKPNTLSQDVPAWRASLKESLQDMTTYDVAGGKSLGANAPYSQSVFLTEKAQGRWNRTVKYNRVEYKRFWKQLIQLAKDNWVDERTKALIDNTGKWSFQKFLGASLDGNVDIVLGKQDFKPKSRAEQVQALTQLVTLAPILMGLPPRQKLRAEEMLGLPPDSNPMSNQISRAFRNIDRIIKGEIVTPLPLVDDAKAQVPVYFDFLVSEKGEDLALENQEAYSGIYSLAITMLMIGVQASMSPAGQFLAPPAPEQSGQGTPAKPGEPKPAGGQVGQPGGGPKTETAQSPTDAQQPISPPAAN